MVSAELDEAVLDQLRRVGGDELVRELARLYRTHTPERMSRARKALATGDLEAAAKAFHSLRSSSATLGAGELAGALGGVEAAARRGDRRAVGRGWAAIEKGVESLLDELADGAAERP